MFAEEKKSIEGQRTRYGFESKYFLFIPLLLDLLTLGKESDRSFEACFST